MNFMRLGSGLLQRVTPAGLILTGATLALTLPPVRNGLRGAAVLTAKGVLMVADEIRSAGAHLKEEVEDIVAEARMGDGNDAWADEVEDLKERVKQGRRKLAVATAAGALALSDRVKSLKDDFDSIIEEAKMARDSLGSAPDENWDERELADGLEAEEVELGNGKH